MHMNAACIKFRKSVKNGTQINADKCTIKLSHTERGRERGVREKSNIKHNGRLEQRDFSSSPSLPLCLSLWKVLRVGKQSGVK